MDEERLELELRTIGVSLRSALRRVDGEAAAFARLRARRLIERIAPSVEASGDDHLRELLRQIRREIDRGALGLAPLVAASLVSGLMARIAIG